MHNIKCNKLTIILYKDALILFIVKDIQRALL